MTGLERQSRREQYRLAGEDAPKWVALAFTLIGTFTALATAWLVIGQAPWLRWPLATYGAQQEYAPPNSATKAAPVSKPGPLVAQSTSITPAEKGQQNIAPPTVADANISQTMPESPKQQSVEASRHPTVEEKVPPIKHADCPPDVGVTFKQASASLTDADKVKLEPLRQWLGSHPKVKLVVEGYADPVGDEQANLILSYRRAKAVAALLNKSGVPQGQLAVRAAGEHEPISGLPDNAADYRRAYLQIEGSENCNNPSTGRGQ